MTLSAAESGSPTSLVLIAGLVVALLMGLVLFAIIARFFRLWIQSWTTGAGIGIFDLLAMTFRKVDTRVIVRSKIMVVQAGLEGISTKQLDAHYLSGESAAGDQGLDRRQQG